MPLRASASGQKMNREVLVIGTFVLPNVYGKWPGGGTGKNSTTFQGVAIELTHGSLISWDGRVIRHCTSIAERPDQSKHVYGTFFAAKSSVVAYGARMSLIKKLRKLIGRPQSGDLGVLPDAVGNHQHVADEADEAGGASLLSSPITRKRNAGDCVEVACADDDDESWDGHSYASHVSHVSGSADSSAMSVGDGGELMHEICIDGDDDDEGPPGEPPAFKPSKNIAEVDMQVYNQSTHGHRMHSSNKGDYNDSEAKHSGAGVRDDRGWRQVDRHYRHPTHSDQREYGHPEQRGYARVPNDCGRGRQERYDEWRTHSDQREYGHPGRGYAGIRDDRGWQRKDRYYQHRPTHFHQHDYGQHPGERVYARVANDGGRGRQERYDERRTHSDRREY